MSPRPFHRQRPLAAIAAAYGLGVWAGVCFAWRPALYALGLLLSFALGFLLRREGRGVFPGAAAAFLFLGALLGGAAGHPELPPAGRYRVTGIVSQDVSLRDDGRAAGYLEAVTLEGEEEERRLSRLYWTYRPDGEEPFLPSEGERVAFQGLVYHPPGQVNPYGFDFRLYLLQKGAAAGVSGAAEAESLGHPGRGLRSFLYRTRNALTERLRLVFGEDSALPEALLLGQKDNLPDETVQGFRDAGAAHVLAVSGLHVGLLAGMVMLLLRRFLSPGPRLAVLAALLFFYSALLGFPASVLRASLLLIILSARRVVRRAYDPLTALGAAFLLILIVRPLDLFSAGFQLSFCAMLGIMTLGPVIENALERLRLPILQEEVSATASATAGVFLPTVQIFHRISLIGLVVNPLLCFLFSLLLPAYAVILILGWVSLPLGQWLAREALGPVSRGVIYAVTRLGDLPFAAARAPSLPWYVVIALVIALALCTRYTLLPGGKKTLLACLLIGASLGCWHLTLCRDVQYIQFAVGRADCAMILDGGETVVIDAGEYGGDPANYLLSTGRQADHLIITHLHADHCLGVHDLLENNVPIGQVYLPVGAEDMDIDPQCAQVLSALRERGIPIRFLAEGDEIALRRTRLTVTWPVREAVSQGQDANQYSMCLLCDLDGITLLSPGDLTGEYEAYAARDADMLKAAHHGGRNSTGEAFLSIVSPDIALIAAGMSASHPHPSTLFRLSESHTDVYSTALLGAVTLTVHDGEGRIAAFLPSIKEQQ